MLNQITIIISEIIFVIFAYYSIFIISWNV